MSYSQLLAESAEGEQLRETLKSLPPGSSILDIGAGFGHVAVYLACLGYRVSTVEPSPDLCERLDRLAHLYGLEITIYNGSGESLDRLPVKDFAACLFHASLHHCDDPARALRNCRQVLRPGGKLFVLNEPLLQFFRSKQWFQQQIDNGTLISGEYGGNEHTYYYGEYIAMLRAAGFTDVRDFPAHRYRSPASYFRCLQSEGAGGLSFLLRRCYYRMIQALVALGPLGWPVLGAMKRLSLLQMNFVGTHAGAGEETDPAQGHSRPVAA